jgi:hypothetical protein
MPTCMYLFLVLVLFSHYTHTYIYTAIYVYANAHIYNKCASFHYYYLFIYLLIYCSLLSKNRSQAATDCNLHSSRSHLIMQITCESHDTVSNLTSYGKLHLIDLAGSERIKQSQVQFAMLINIWLCFDLTFAYIIQLSTPPLPHAFSDIKYHFIFNNTYIQVEGQQLKETLSINKSLSSLSEVIAARALKRPHTPYRNSTLTFLLQDALSGVITIIIVLFMLLFTHHFLSTYNQQTYIWINNSLQ